MLEEATLKEINTKLIGNCYCSVISMRGAELFNRSFSKPLFHKWFLEISSLNWVVPNKFGMFRQPFGVFKQKHGNVKETLQCLLIDLRVWISKKTQDFSWFHEKLEYNPLMMEWSRNDSQHGVLRIMDVSWTNHRWLSQFSMSGKPGSSAN